MGFGRSEVVMKFTQSHGFVSRSWFLPQKIWPFHFGKCLEISHKINGTWMGLGWNFDGDGSLNGGTPHFYGRKQDTVGLHSQEPHVLVKKCAGQPQQFI